jgi:TetR/AcrR family acrAB operon transcriptional repressor
MYVYLRPKFGKIMRRTKEEAEQTRNKILSAAIKVMNKKGISSTRFEDIAKEAKVTRGAVYHYFKSKNEILIAIHENNKKKLFLIFEKYFNETIDPVISLKNGLKEIFAKFEEDREFRAVEELFLKVEFTSLIKEDKALHSLFEKDKEETIAKMFDLVKRGQVSGSIRKDIAVENLGHAIISFYIGFISLWFMQVRQFSIKEKSGDYIDILLHGILK